MDPTDSAPDSWEQEDEVEEKKEVVVVEKELVVETEAPAAAAVVDGQQQQLDAAFTALNVNAKPFVPNINAAEFVPAFLMKGPSETPGSGGEFYFASVCFVSPVQTF